MITVLDILSEKIKNISNSMDYLLVSRERMLKKLNVNSSFIEEIDDEIITMIRKKLEIEEMMAKLSKSL